LLPVVEADHILQVIQIDMEVLILQEILVETQKLLLAGLMEMVATEQEEVPVVAVFLQMEHLTVVVVKADFLT
jgi:hypothetical protein